MGMGRSVIIRDGKVAEEDPSDKRWAQYHPGKNYIVMDFSQPVKVKSVMVRMLNSSKDGIVPPAKLHLSVSVDGQLWNLVQIKDSPVFPNTRHDAFVDCVLFDGFPEDFVPGCLKLEFFSEDKVFIDEIFINPATFPGREMTMWRNCWSILIILKVGWRSQAEIYRKTTPLIKM